MLLSVIVTVSTKYIRNNQNFAIDLFQRVLTTNDFGIALEKEFKSKTQQGHLL